MIREDLADRAVELLRRMTEELSVGTAIELPADLLVAFRERKALAAVLSSLPDDTRRGLHDLYRQELDLADRWPEELVEAEWNEEPYVLEAEALVEEVRRDRLIGQRSINDPWNKP